MILGHDFCRVFYGLGLAFWSWLSSVGEIHIAKNKRLVRHDDDFFSLLMDLSNPPPMQERLKEEIEGEVCRLGRVSLVDLAATLGVELIHCERQAQQIVGNNTDLSLVQGEILAATYWDSVAEEINETLQEAGQISVGELARQFNVGAELLTGVLGSRLGTLVCIQHLVLFKSKGMLQILYVSFSVPCLFRFQVT